ncbi:hypothetical protein H2509_06135 [Stappia sp. F7233]|uniref:Uncharacterized protein n=1 Tax=Stappia albiluteola TaxID=2758565 RepID=A0A839ACJ5_9HYPH|nr:hypothetical protein [Stappia albiluteola]MBA5776704.1 hypothetical protein [Stappia albiluteola]
MSDFHKPTYSLKNPDGSSKAYNPTEVRLYGLSGSQSILAKGANSFEVSSGGNRFNISVNAGASGAKKGGSPASIPGISLINISNTSLGSIVALLCLNSSPDDELEAGVIFGYSYEGHCYDLPKPKVMLIPAQGVDIPADDCGYHNKPDYKVWVVDKLDQCIEIEVNQGFIEQVVLEANLPGKRSPSTYRATMALSHRSGRLTE